MARLTGAGGAGALFAVIALGLAIASAGCINRKEGSGVEASETRELGSFTKISLSGEATVEVTIGDPQSVIVRTDDNLLADVETEVNADTLEVSEPSLTDLDPTAGMVVEVTVPELGEVEVSGSGDLSVTGVEGELFRAEVSGAGTVEASGEVEQVEAEVSGAGDVQLSQLIAQDATADVSGAGNIHVHATESLQADVSGAGDIIYSGDPADVETDVSGAGDIRAG